MFYLRDIEQKNMTKKILLILFLLNISTIIYAQRVSISTDVLKWASLSPNIGVDLILSSRLSLNIEGVSDPLISDEIKRISVSTELRYWFKRPLYSHYVGVNFITSMYDFKLPHYKIKGAHHRYKGHMVGIGIGYGYSLIVSKRVSFTPNIGIGYGYVHSYTNPYADYPTLKAAFRPVLTRIGVSFSYIIN